MFNLYSIRTVMITSIHVSTYPHKYSLQDVRIFNDYSFKNFTWSHSLGLDAWLAITVSYIYIYIYIYIYTYTYISPTVCHWNVQQVAQPGLSTTEPASCHRNATPVKDKYRFKRHKELQADLQPDSYVKCSWKTATSSTCCVFRAAWFSIEPAVCL